MASGFDTWVGNAPLVTDTITNPDGSAKNLTGATVRFRMRPAHASNLVVDSAATVVSAPAGTVSYQMLVGDTATAGRYAAWWQVTIGGVPVDTGEFNIDVNAHAPLDFTASGPIVGPCSSWITGAEVDSFCSSGSSMAGGPDYDFAARMASEILFELSGRQFAGACTSIVRPCAQSCGCWGGGGFIGQLAISGAAQLGVPINWTGGSWECGGISCGCGVLSEVILDGYPVTGITAVKINGVVQAPSTYRLDQYRRLVCTNSQLWPVCQDLTRDDTQQGTWSVAYTHGMEPPLAGKQAACQLGCQLKLAMGGQSCQLSESVQEVARQGVRVTKGRLATLVNAISEKPEGTGLALVDAFLVAYNRRGLDRRPAVWTPDFPRMPRRQL